MSVLNNSNAISTGGADYNLESSLRLRSSATAYLSRTNTSTVTNNKILTYSAWIKRGKLTTFDSFLFGNASGANMYCYFETAADKISFAGNSVNFETTASFRDTSAWYHIVIALDQTQTTREAGIKIYVNGVEQAGTFSGSAWVQNTAWLMNTASTPVLLGKQGGLSRYFDGYMTEINFVDGQALTPSDFGETDTTTGVWKPKEYTGTYGTNGFYLPMNGSKEAYTADYLVIAGGGGGGASYGGGGGAGGYQTSTATLAISTTYTITVGGGGAGSTSSALRGTQGSNSVLSGTGITTITSTGGGGGGSANDSSGQIIGGNGGSGGGGAANATGGTVTTAGGTGTSGQGNNGGSGSTDSLTYRGAGGGGGASAVGANGNSSSGGNGGAGTASSITGSSVTYAGGGGGGAAAISAGTGGTGGGGAGTNSGSGTAGTVNTGGGGGGAAANNGGSGGSGIVILRMPTANYTGTTTGSPTVTTDGSDTILTYTSSGTYTA